MPENSAFELVVAPATDASPRNGEAAIVHLKGGGLLLGWTEFYAGSGADQAPARLVGRTSQDGGHTWGPKYTLVEDGGETWARFKDIEDDAWARPAVTWVGDVALVTYFTYSGGHSLKLRAIPANWFLA